MLKSSRDKLAPTVHTAAQFPAVSRGGNPAGPWAALLLTALDLTCRSELFLSAEKLASKLFLQYVRAFNFQPYRATEIQPAYGLRDS